MSADLGFLAADSVNFSADLTEQIADFTVISVFMVFCYQPHLMFSINLSSCLQITFNTTTCLFSMDVIICSLKIYRMISLLTNIYSIIQINKLAFQISILTNYFHIYSEPIERRTHSKILFLFLFQTVHRHGFIRSRLILNS